MELDNGVEGLVHMTTLKDDYYDYIESQYALVGTHHKRRYQLGDTVEILLARADLEARSLDFLVKDNCDLRALQMQDSEDRKAGAEGRGREKAKGRAGKVKGGAAKAGRRAKKSKAAADTGREEARRAGGQTGRKKNKKDKHSKRKGKRRSGGDVIASFDPLTI